MLVEQQHDGPHISTGELQVVGGRGRGCGETNNAVKSPVSMDEKQIKQMKAEYDCIVGDLYKQIDKLAAEKAQAFESWGAA